MATPLNWYEQELENLLVLKEFGSMPLNESI